MTEKGTIRGALMGLSADGNFISCETNAEMHFDTEMIPASSVSSGYFREKVPGKQDWRMQVDGYLLKRAMASDFKTLFTSWRNRQPVQLQFRTRPWVDQYLIFEGEAWVQQGSLLAPNRGLSNWTIVFDGNGVLNMDWEEFWMIINAMPPTADWPTVVEQDPDNWTT
jgi:predicted secreted protein